MPDIASLLPPNSTALERAFEQAAAPEPRLTGAIGTIPGVKADRMGGWVPFLLWEMGFSELTAYVPNNTLLLDEGEDWQIERGTFAAISRALGWLDIAATIEEAPTRRAWWNAFQLGLSRLPGADQPDLTRIDRLAGLSAPLRSDFRRGFFGYDVRAAELDTSPLDSAMSEDESGVRLRDGGPLWSFGRDHEAAITLGEAEATELGIWIPEVAGAALTWGDIPTAWNTASFPWASNAAVQRRILMAGGAASLSAYCILRDDDGEVIGYRRCRVSQTVSPVTGGEYAVAGGTYAAQAQGESLYLEAQTDFGDGVGAIVGSLAFVLGGEVAEGVAPGKLWLEAGELVGGVEVGPREVSIPLRLTVREKIKLLMRF